MPWLPGCWHYWPTQEILFNQMHARSRSTIDILKWRWMCLDSAGGKLLYKPENVINCYKIFLDSIYSAYLWLSLTVTGL